MNVNTFSLNNPWALILIGAVILILIAVAVWAQVQRKRRHSAILRQRFGPEYARAVNELGRGKAEAELEARRRRVAELRIVPLPAADAARFRQSWNELQGRFVDDPKAAVVQADHLIYNLMERRGYPMGDFERRAADISVDHPLVVSNYRAARAIALADERGLANTEQLRKALVHYRALFDELAEVPGPDRPVLRTTHIPVNS